MNGDPLFRVRVAAPTAADLRAFIDDLDADIGCRPVARRTAEGVTVQVFLSEAQIPRAHAAAAARSSLTVEVLEDQARLGRERQAEVGVGDRFAVRGEIPRGVGRKE